MKKAFKIFWISFAVYSLLTFAGSMIIEHNENNLGFLIDMKGYIPLLKYYTFLGLVFFTIAFISLWRHRLLNKKESQRFETEKKELKATIYDLQEKIAADNRAVENPEPPAEEE